MCGAQEPYSVVLELGPGRRRHNILVAAKEDNWAESHLTKVFVLLGTEESLTHELPPRSLLCCSPLRLGKARVERKE